MLRSILLALDGSENSDAVVELGIRWTQQLGTKLVGICVVDQPTMISSTPASERDEEAGELQGHWKVEEQRVAQYLEQFSRRCAESGVDARTIKDVGPPADRIVLEANRHDLLLLNPHFKTATSGGDTFGHALRDAPRPVVSVPKQLPAGDAIVIAFDGSVQSSRTLQAFAMTELIRSKNVAVVSINDDLHKAASRAALAIDFLKLHDVDAESRPLKPAGTVAEQLLAEVEALEAGLLVLGSHRRSTLQEMFLGSVTKSILNKSTVPLFMFH